MCGLQVRPRRGVIEGIIEQSGTPYFCFKDIDENKPVASIKLRVETIHYFLKSYCEEMTQQKQFGENNRAAEKELGQFVQSMLC